jgi:hypothetical protein
VDILVLCRNLVVHRRVPGLTFRISFELMEMGFEGYVKHEIL